jgi:hypothetical protein
VKIIYTLKRVIAASYTVPVILVTALINRSHAVVNQDLN